MPLHHELTPSAVPADDAMAILAAFNSPEVEVIGLTTIYGNVPTLLATQNALRLVEMAGKQGKVCGASVSAQPP